jgi:hypothetical protein
MAGVPDKFMVSVLDRPLVVFRASFGAAEHDLLDALRSNYERGRGGNPSDLYATVVHMAVSGFEDRDGLARLARRRPERIGSHIVRLDLRPGLGICCTDATGGPGHWSIWATPAHLLACVTDVERV